MAAKGGAVRACDSLCVFARVLRVTLFFFYSSVRVCDWDVCGRGVCEREDGGQLNSRCLKSVGLTGCHKTAC